jgi:hypothetical protein
MLWSLDFFVSLVAILKKRRKAGFMWGGGGAFEPLGVQMDATPPKLGDVVKEYARPTLWIQNPLITITSQNKEEKNYTQRKMRIHDCAESDYVLRDGDIVYFPYTPELFEDP